jgi:hypothetical protein
MRGSTAVLFMVKTRPKQRGSISGVFAWRLIEMLESPANRVLSLSAKRGLERLEIELARHGGKSEENGRLPCTFDHPRGLAAKCDPPEQPPRPP